MTEQLDASGIINAVGNLAAKLNEAQRQLDNANRINQEMAAAATRLERENARLRAQAPAELAGLRDDLSNAVGNINNVVHQQMRLLAGTGSLARAADIRRRQIAKGYTVEHDRAIGTGPIVTAAMSLIARMPGTWPWNPSYYDHLADDPDRLLHAAAMLAAVQDVRDAEEVPF